jgi:hypothetical protein
MRRKGTVLKWTGCGLEGHTSSRTVPFLLVVY